MTQNFIQSIEELIPITASKYANKPINKENIRERLMMLDEKLTDVNNMFMALVPSDRKIMAKRIVDATKIKTNVACDIYCKIAKTLKRDDMNSAWSSYIALCLSYKKIVGQFTRSLDKWFDAPKISVYNTKLSQVVVYGMLDEAELFCKYTTSLFSFVVFELTQHNNISELQEPKKYRKMLIVDKCDTFTMNSIRRLSDNPFVFADDMEKAKDDIDVNIVDQDGHSAMGFVNPANIPASLRHSIGIGSKSLVMNIFRWMGEQWILHKHLKYLRQRKEKEWMEAHVALLQMDLQNKDPNSDEYRKLVAVIDNYNEQIAALDQKLAAYEEE